MHRGNPVQRIHHFNSCRTQVKVSTQFPKGRRSSTLEKWTDKRSVKYRGKKTTITSPHCIHVDLPTEQRLSQWSSGNARDVDGRGGVQLQAWVGNQTCRCIGNSRRPARHAIYIGIYIYTQPVAKCRLSRCWQLIVYDGVTLLIVWLLSVTRSWRQARISWWTMNSPSLPRSLPLNFVGGCRW